MNKINKIIILKKIQPKQVIITNKRVVSNTTQQKKKLQPIIKKQTKHFYQKNEDVRVDIKIYNNRGDIDNLVKNILDALTGTVYEDDNQVTELHAYKYRTDDKQEKCIIYTSLV